ncbi:MAG TPA: glycosyltransferase [Dinghuibacter sp.]|uniref:glycosyltransferase family 2 protein n=1 Tax=Dinghuibacter sp. TaxID=2024697 RepID=UPI002BD6DFFF|nr:glycosyltransferase [Dinghuibacter sp.]HTJ14903.1 glycosyltransferase [Dinghuibacter sp.]
MASERIPIQPPPIKPVDDGRERPLWSVMIPAYNCTAYLTQCIESVLAQDPGESLMQIEVVDDASTDEDVCGLVARIGCGRVGYFRQPVNVGSLRNFETCLNRARGQWVHLLHGDDYVSPGFYEEIAGLFRDYPAAGAAFTGYYHVAYDGTILYTNPSLGNARGPVSGWLDIIAQGQQIQPPSIVVKRSVYEQLGGFFAVHYGEDWEMWIRISAHYEVVRSPARLANYRVHGGNISSQYHVSGQNIRDIQKVIHIVQDYLPPEKRKRLKRLARKNYALYFARSANTVYHVYKQPWSALRQAFNALRMHVNPVTLNQALKVCAKVIFRYRWKGDKEALQIIGKRHS